jgi:hypothetical protein
MYPDATPVVVVIVTVCAAPLATLLVAVELTVE